MAPKFVKNCCRWWDDEAGVGCMLNRKGTGPARVDGGRCSRCPDGAMHCAGHCPLKPTGANGPRGFPERRVLPEQQRRSRSPARVARESAKERDDRQAAQEGRRYCRRAIQHSLLAQWRRFGNDFGRRPLPTEGADAGLVPGVCWADALHSQQTRELLRSEQWRSEREHDSVRMTLFLKWAEQELAEQASRRLGALELGRQIMHFCG